MPLLIRFEAVGKYVIKWLIRGLGHQLLTSESQRCEHCKQRHSSYKDHSMLSSVAGQACAGPVLSSAARQNSGKPVEDGHLQRLGGQVNSPPQHLGTTRIMADSALL